MGKRHHQFRANMFSNPASRLNSVLNQIEDELELSRSEIGILVLLIGIGLYMLIESFSFDNYAVQRFPLLTSLGTIICSIIILLRSYIPDSVSNVVFDPDELIQMDSDQVEVDNGKPEIATNMQKIYMTMGQIVLYAINSYIISLLYATPLFVAVYAIWTRQSWYIVTLLTVLAFSVGYLFMTVLYVPLDEGLIIPGVFV